MRLYVVVSICLSFLKVHNFVRCTILTENNQSVRVLVNVASVSLATRGTKLYFQEISASGNLSPSRQGGKTRSRSITKVLYVQKTALIRPTRNAPWPRRCC